MNTSTADITVIICTRNRADSLRVTLEALARANREGLRCELVVVDNGNDPATPGVAREFLAAFPVHCLREETPGKCHAANRALADAPLGKLVVFLDDDMSPDANWFQGVKAIADRWPNADLFTGRSHVVWPEAAVPSWCRHPQLRGWAFSVMGRQQDTPLASGNWYSGNHFWVRSRVLADGRRFGTHYSSTDIQIYTSEPQFMLQLVEDGFAGVQGPDAVCGHRIQPGLLRLEDLTERARRAGRGFAVARLQPFKSSVKQCRLFHDHPWLARLYCLASLVGWTVWRGLVGLDPRRDQAIPRRLYAIQRQATYREYLRVAGAMSEYRLFRSSSR